MADAGVIALDPVRLGGLEVYLQGLGDGCRRRAGKVADACAGSGLSVDHPVAELERLAAICHREHDEVAWRRALVEALPHDLPLPAARYRSPQAAAVAAEALAARVSAALDARPPRWTQLVPLLAELDRSAGSGPFTVAFLRSLGARRTRELPLVLERAWDAWWEPPPGPAGRPVDRRPTEADRAGVEAVQERLAAVVGTASQVQGDDGLDERWCRAYAGLPAADDDLAAIERAAGPAGRAAASDVERRLKRTGLGLRVAANVAKAVAWQRAAAVLKLDRGLLAVVVAPVSLLEGDGIACDGAETVVRATVGALTVLGALVPGVGLPATMAAGVLSGVAAVLSECEPQPARPNETRPTVDPRTGESRLPSGHQSNPHVDGAGVPLPPSYGVGP